MESIVIPMHKKGEKQRVENCRGISLFNELYKLYSKVLNEKLLVQAEEFLWYAKMVCLSIWGRQFNLETHLAFRDCVKAFDRVTKEANCLKYCKAKILPIYY
jgi:hypothetical protein